MEKVTFGFIGLGNMGGAMAANLAAAGFGLCVYDQAGTGERAPAGAVAATSAAEVAKAVGTVFLSLPDGAASLAVAREIAAAPDRTAAFVVDFSTTGVAAAWDIAGVLADVGIGFADAPVSGGRAGAVAGTLAIMWAGPADVLDGLRPALEEMAGNLFHVGATPGQGQAMKLLNNFLSGTAMAATSEAIAYGAAQGLDAGTMVEVLNASTGRNTATSDKFPNRILTGAFDSGFQTALMAKDMRLYRESARELGMRLDIGERVTDTWQRMESALPDSDFTRIFEFIQGTKSS